MGVAIEKGDCLNGEEIYALAKRIFPICRSITGNGVRQTLSILKEYLPELNIYEVASGQQVFDWTIPDEWNVRSAKLEKLNGDVVLDFKETNLHLVNYSTAMDGVVSRSELFEHLHYREDMPDAIPYVTRYYNREWGFCLSANQAAQLTDDYYRVKIDTVIKPGAMTFADLVVPGESEEEILVSTYTCHPSMGNNEVSGIAVATFLAKYILSLPARRYTYRFVFVPETIGAVAYIAQHLQVLKERVKAGIILTCVGDNNAWSFLPSRLGTTYADKVARFVIDSMSDVVFSEYSFLQRGSDERQYCAPGVDLPVISLMRSKYGTYRQYHTSKDNLDFISPEGLYGGFLVNRKFVDVLEANCVPKHVVLCEPFLSSRGLRPQLTDGVMLEDWSQKISNVLAYADGNHDLIDMSRLLNTSIWDIKRIVDMLSDNNLLLK